MPEASCRTMPARSMRRWETISASLGVSRRIGKKYRESRMGSALRLELRLAPAVKPDRPAKHKSAKQFNGFSEAAGRAGRFPAQLTIHGAVHDKPDDKLDLFGYTLLTRNMAANNAILLCV